MKASIYFQTMDMDKARFGVWPDCPKGIEVHSPSNTFTVEVKLEDAGAVNSMPQTEIVERCLSYLMAEMGLERTNLAF